MRIFYIILSITGWSWFIIVMAFLAWRLRVKRRLEKVRGFDVSTTIVKDSQA
jgi:hypothetical protein